MSVADTAEYQLAALADAMTRITRDAGNSGWRSTDYQDGFTAAMDAVASEMMLKIRTVKSYEF